MKKFLLVLAVAVVSVQFSNAQEKPISVDVQAGLPMGDISDLSNFYVGLNLTYMFAEVAEDFYLGGRAGYNIYLGEDNSETVFGQTITAEGVDFDFVTLAVVGRYDFTENLFGRLDLGYAVGLEEDSDGAVFIEPRFGYSAEMFDVFAFYQNIFDSDISIGAVGVGFAYKF